MAFKLTDLEVRRALKLPFSGQGAWSRILLGGGIWLIPMLAAYLNPWAGAALAVLSLLITAGYCLRVAQQETNSTAEDRPRQLPAMDNFEELFVSGLKVVSLVAVYAASFAAVAMLTKYFSGLPLFDMDHLKEHGEPTGLITTLFMMAGGFLAVGYLPAMCVHYARERTFKSGFHAWTILKVEFPSGRASCDAMLASYLAFVMTLPFACTGILFPPALFVAQLLAANFWGQAYRLSRFPEKKPGSTEGK